MLFYPDYQEEEEYLNACVKYYHQKYYMFSKKEISRSIKEIIFCYLKGLLEDDCFEERDVPKLNRAKFIGEMFDLTKEEMVRRCPPPSITFHYLFMLSSAKMETVKFILKDSKIDFPENEQESYLNFIHEMTKKCALEIAEMFVRNVPCEVKQEALKEEGKKMKKEDNEAPKKRVHWENDSNDLNQTTPKRRKKI